MSESQVTSDMLDDEILDDLADLPQIAPFPAGAHLAKMYLTKKPGKVKDGVTAPPSYLATFEYINVLELVDPTKVAPAAGDKTFINIYTKKKNGEPNEFGQGQLKLLIAPIAEKLGTNSVNAIIEATSKNGIEVAITTGIKKSEGYADSMTVVKLMLA